MTVAQLEASVVVLIGTDGAFTLSVPIAVAAVAAAVSSNGGIFGGGSVP
jgi:hypothetical protein